MKNIALKIIKGKGKIKKVFQMVEELKNENIISEFIDNIQKAKGSFKSLNCNKETLLNNYNYVLTNNAKERLDKLYIYIYYGIPVLLDGETGCSKL